MFRTVLTRRSGAWLGCLVLTVLVVLVSACGSSTPPAKPAAWTTYQNTTFTMAYLNNWGVATKDVYLGTSYPALEMLQGMAFTSPDSANTFVQVVYAGNAAGKASVSDLLSKYILGTLKQPLAASSLTTKTLAGETWSTASVEKQASADGGSAVAVKEVALGVSRAVNGQQEIYLILYQDATSSFSQTDQTSFTRMVNSFQFGS